MDSDISIFAPDDILKVEGGDINKEYTEDTYSRDEDINSINNEYYDSFGTKLETYTYNNITLLKDDVTTETQTQIDNLIASLLKESSIIINSQMEELMKEREYHTKYKSYNRYNDSKYTSKKRNRDYSNEHYYH